MTHAHHCLASLAAIVILSITATSRADLIAYWPFDEVSGSTAADASTSGLSHPGALRGFANANDQWNPAGGLFGGSLSFSEGGSNAANRDNALIMATNKIAVGSAWTISTWFFGPLPDTGTDWHTLARGEVEDHHVLANNLTNELGSFENGGSSFNSSGFDMDTLTVPEWNHLAAVGEGGVTTFYVNGQQVGTAGFQAQTEILSIGNHHSQQGSSSVGGSQRFADELDDTGVFADAITEGQAIAIFNAAMEPTLHYDLGQMEQLFQLAEGNLQTVQLGDLVWRRTTNASGALGEIVPGLFDSLSINFGSGIGVTTLVPEPATLNLLLVLTLAARRCRRRTTRRSNAV